MANDFPDLRTLTVLFCQIAIYGKNFCVSAKNAFKLLMRNILRFLLHSHSQKMLTHLWQECMTKQRHVCAVRRVVVLDKVTDVLLFFGKLLVVGGVGEEEILYLIL